MGNIGDPVTQPIPAVGSGGTGYATQVNAFLTEVAARLSAKLPIASILVGLFDMAANAIKNVSYLAFSDAGTTPSSPSASVQSFAGDMWWVSPSGAIQVTSGNTLNAAALSGITGDYGGGNPAQFRYVNTDKEFYAYQDFAGGKWAYMGGLGLDIFGGLTSAVKAHITYGGAGTINLVLPPALPAGPAVLFLDNTGAITTTAQPTVDLVMGTNANVKLQGTGYLKQGNVSVTFALTNAGWHVTSGSLPSYASAGGTIENAASNVAYFPIPFPSDQKRWQTLSFWAYQNGGTSGTVSVVSADTLGGAYAAITGASVSVASGGGQAFYTITPNSPFTPTSGQTLWLKVAPSATGPLGISGCRFTSDTP